MKEKAEEGKCFTAAFEPRRLGVSWRGGTEKERNLFADKGGTYYRLEI